MSARDQILSFLDDPGLFALGAADPDIWLDALTEHAEPLLKAAEAPELRAAQVAAWRGLADTRVGLILGPPGTGKTHLMAWLIVGYILARRKQGKSARVFVSAFTRNAIGNLLEGIAERAEKFAPGEFATCFLGPLPPSGLKGSVQPRPSVSGSGGEAILAELGAEAIVVGASVWQLHKLLGHGKAPGDKVLAPIFDLVCIDEASQLVLSQGLMAMAGLKPDGRVIVAGDDRQLPPIRAGRNVEVNGRQLGGSLYSFLKSGGVPEFPLVETFRLNAPLTAFPEKTFYPGQYESAEKAKDRRLALKPNWREGLQPWEAYALDPDWPIAILVHDAPPAATSNPFEAWVTARLAALLADRMEGARLDDGAYAGDLWSERLAAVSPHRAQNAAIRTALSPALKTGAFVETVDRIQGKERDAVLLSYCVADSEFALAEADFIFAPERLNVAITRARFKLIVVISRRLLEALPNDQEQLDKAELLREFVSDAAEERSVEIVDGAGQTVQVLVRLAGFDDAPILAEPPVVEAPVQGPSSALSDDDIHLMQAIEDVALESAYGTAASFVLEKKLGRKSVLAGLSRLQGRGFIDLWQQNHFWVARPLKPIRRVYACDYETVKGRSEEAISQARRGRKPSLYEDVKRRFAWVNEDGEDVVRSAFDRLSQEGLVRFSSEDGKMRLDWIGDEVAELPPLEPTPELSDEDFEVLNALEAMDAKRINFGVFEGWTSPATLADSQGWDRSLVNQALARLAAAKWVMFADDRRVRSRMGELAREVRYVKQRFQRDDADKRPFLVRSLKVELRDRDKPSRTEPLAETFETLAKEVSGSHAVALRALSRSLQSIWTPNATIAGFQRRSLEALTRAWGGGGQDAFVISADTGAGKTEAAALPVIAGAAADRLDGIKGVRALLAYPRIRLATNQAERLVKYAALLAQQPDAPTLTVGMQFKGTPTRLDRLQPHDLDEGWRALGGGEFSFPLFGCPQCQTDLHLTERKGVAGADRLHCVTCHWSFNGWIGSKNALRETPPALFVTTTDSLHQWLHAPAAGRLFGDDGAYAPPRVVLADEIHLYTHVHGAQVAMTLQRLAGRAAINDPSASPVLMVGMSATLGDPAKTWGRLAGRESVMSITPEQNERLPNPRGREYFYFVQPEVESRGADVAGASTTIQSLMCLAHGMRRRTDDQGGFRSIVFLDSIDKVRRLHGDYTDAEEAKKLAAYRTRLYPEDPATGELPTQCCGEPHGCDRFQTGECWIFAATDNAQMGAQGRRRPGRPLAVVEKPISSASVGRVESDIKAADVIFATSSLEVGYDDPDITLVYQHYAPRNLASFIQRKGRGGRGADDRPTTAVTLSIYSSRDSWWFRQPEKMLEPADFDTPLNPENYFVRRGQVLSTVLDAFARVWRLDGAFDVKAPPAMAFAEAEALVRLVFGYEAWKDYADDIPAFWNLAVTKLRPGDRFDDLRSLREALEWAPNLLFDSINLPRLGIVRPKEDKPRPEDISLAMASVAPGNATRRYHPVEVDWRPPVAGAAPWFAVEDYAKADKPKPFGDDGQGWLSRLPLEARPLLVGLSAHYIRPRSITLERLGQVHGATWSADWGLNAQDVLVRHRDAPPNRLVQHQSHGHLRGFPIVKPADDAAREHAAETLRPWIERLDSFVGDGVGGKTTGLALARVFWGADSEIIIGQPRDVVPVSQIFTAPGCGPTLHGYHVQTEGVRFRVDSARLDAFIAAEQARLEAEPEEKKRVVSQIVRWKLESGAQALGLNMFQMRRAAELIASAIAVPTYLERLRKLVFLWDGKALATLFMEAREDLLSCHPLLSIDRVPKVAEAFANDRLKPVLSEALGGVDDAGALAAWLRSALLHSLALRLKESFVELGHGDERQVLAHVALPLQFGSTTDAHADIVLCEVGSYGDGTTRAFVERLEEAAAHWRNGFLADCPNAQEDAALERFFDLPQQHPTWRALDPQDPASLASIAQPLGLDPSLPLPPALLRVLFGVEAVGSERFDLYDLALAVRSADRALKARLGRQASAWEVTSAVVKQAQETPASTMGKLLAAYASLDEGLQEEGLSAVGRLSDQAYRLSARLCVDGCQACVQRPSDLMSEGLMEASTSRRLLGRFLCEPA